VTNGKGPVSVALGISDGFTGRSPEGWEERAGKRVAWSLGRPDCGSFQDSRAAWPSKADLLAVSMGRDLWELDRFDSKLPRMTIRCAGRAVTSNFSRDTDGKRKASRIAMICLKTEPDTQTEDEESAVEVARQRGLDVLSWGFKGRMNATETWRQVLCSADALLVAGKRDWLDSGAPEAQRLGLPVFYSDPSWAEYVYHGGRFFFGIEELREAIEHWQQAPHALANLVWPVSWKEELRKLIEAVSRLDISL
jgi:hypothetical protein